jgi:hypothetical protein
MFAGIHGDKLFLRLSESELMEIMNARFNLTRFEPMPGRPIAGHVVLPKPVYSDDKLFAKWLDKSVEFVFTLPPKQKKKK